MNENKADSAAVLAQGVYKVCLGAPEAQTPQVENNPKLPVAAGTEETLPGMVCRQTARGFRIELMLQEAEEIFGFGLQLKSVAHKGTAKVIRPNADPVADTGDSHAPVPFFISSRGHGVLLATYRHVRFHCGVGKDKRRSRNQGNAVTVAVEDLYEKVRLREPSTMVMDIPVAQGVTLYYFAADSVGGVVQQYNLLAGGGCMPPLWGLGPQFRCYARYSQQQVEQTAQRMREQQIPCTMLGLEPGWQTHSYPCSLKWDNVRFPDPAAMVRRLGEQGFHLSLWEHAFLDAASPLYPRFEELSGEYEVWKGLVPDFGLEEARRIFTDYHREQFVALGIDGFKLDECDGSDYTGGWSYPDCTLFPSGLDGEQMHHAYGMQYQRAVLAALGDRRTFSLVRSSGIGAAALPFALYSDLYGYQDFRRGNVTAGYSGLLWAPEVRDAASKEEFIARLELAVFSAFTLINGWYMEELPWTAADALAETRDLLGLRMALVPYLYAAYREYSQTGTPPVRGLPCDYGHDPQTHGLQGQYLLGPGLLVAPAAWDETQVQVYLPQGDWFDFWTGEAVESGWQQRAAHPVPVFVKGGTILPLARPQAAILPDTVFDLTPVCYGDCRDAVCLLPEDDGCTHSTQWAQVMLTRTGLAGQSRRYRLQGFMDTPQGLAPAYTKMKDVHQCS